MVFATLTVALAMGAGCQVSSPAQTQVLVELYTSQGCSSCPPADRWLSQFDPAQLDQRTAAGVVPLALHVGYWDYIGWKDPYARRDFNARQQWLAEINRNRTVYTPGVFVQARETRRWYEASSFNAAVRAIGAQPARARIDLAVERTGTDTLQVRADATLAPQVRGGEAKLFVALTESGIDTRVKAGENRGATLRNDHVARDWSGPLALGRQSIALSVTPGTAGSAEAQRAVVAFVQDMASGDVLQAVRLPLAACTQ
jgi:hypothetical protein